MKYVQAARVNYWEQIGLYKLYTENKHSPMLASTQCEFKKTIVLSRRSDYTFTNGFYQKLKFWDFA